MACELTGVFWTHSIQSYVTNAFFTSYRDCPNLFATYYTSFPGEYFCHILGEFPKYSGSFIHSPRFYKFAIGRLLSHRNYDAPGDLVFINWTTILYPQQGIFLVRQIFRSVVDLTLLGFRCSTYVNWTYCAIAFPPPFSRVTRATIVPFPGGLRFQFKNVNIPSFHQRSITPPQSEVISPPRL